MLNMCTNAVLYKILNSEFLQCASLPDEGWGRTITVASCGPLGSLAQVSNGVGQRRGGCPPGEPVTTVVSLRVIAGFGSQ